MNRNAPLAVVLTLACSVATAAQDVLTIGSGVAAPGGTTAIAVSILDRTGTALGSDAGDGNLIHGFAFKVLFPPEVVSGATFARAGIAAGATPLFESTMQGEGWLSYVAAFSEALALTPDAGVPGNPVGTLTVTIDAGAAAGATAVLRLDAPSAALSNQAGTLREGVSNGGLALVNGSVRASGVAAPFGLVALAAGTSSVDLTWSGVPGVDHYEIWRSAHGAAYSFAGTSVAAAFSDDAVVANTTYLYRVRAHDAGDSSAFSNIDAATTIVFTDDPLVVRATNVSALHLTELHLAVNAMRDAAGLPPMADPDVAAGTTVLAAHVTVLRSALAEARSTAGLPAVMLTDVTLSPGVTLIKAVHVGQLRLGVK